MKPFLSWKAQQRCVWLHQSAIGYVMRMIERFTVLVCKCRNVACPGRYAFACLPLWPGCAAGGVSLGHPAHLARGAQTAAACMSVLDIVKCGCFASVVSDMLWHEDRQHPLYETLSHTIYHSPAVTAGSQPALSHWPPSSQWGPAPTHGCPG